MSSYLLHFQFYCKLGQCFYLNARYFCIYFFLGETFWKKKTVNFRWSRHIPAIHLSPECSVTYKTIKQLGDSTAQWRLAKVVRANFFQFSNSCTAFGKTRNFFVMPWLLITKIVAKGIVSCDILTETNRYCCNKQIMLSITKRYIFDFFITLMTIVRFAILINQLLDRTSVCNKFVKRLLNQDRLKYDLVSSREG